MRQLEDEKLQIKWSHIYAGIHNRKARVGDADVEEKLSTIVSVIDHLGNFKCPSVFVRVLHVECPEYIEHVSFHVFIPSIF